MQLKRFNYQARKITRDIPTPEFISLSPYEKYPQVNPSRCELIGVVVHYGGSLTSGHYIAYVKSNGKWYNVFYFDIV